MTKDVIEREYFKNNNIFASLFNYYLFDGKEIIKEDELKELDTTLVTTNPILKRERDIYKKAILKTDGKKSYLLLGIENQTSEDSKMVIRNMIYDSLSYHNQIQNIENNSKNDKIKMKIYPVITLVIYYSHKRWTGKKNLYSMLEIKDNNLKKYISNYKLNIIEPYRMEESDFNKLNNDLGLLFEFIKNSGDKDKLIEHVVKNDKYRKVRKETVELINAVTNANINVEEKDVIDMCKAIEDLKAEGKVEGKTEAIQENIKTMNKNGFDIDTIAKALSLDINYVKKVLA